MKQKVEVGNFVTVLDGKFSENGIKKGTLLYVAGDLVVSVTEKDPYALRRVFIATTVVDGHIQTKGVKPFTIDGKRLEPVSKSKQKMLDNIKKADFGEVPEGDADIEQLGG